MPQVPSYDNFQTSRAAQPNVQFQGGGFQPGGGLNAPSGPTPGAVAGEQLGALGKAAIGAGDAVGKIVADMQHEANTTVVKDTDNQMALATTEALYNPKTGFITSKLGKDTVDGYDDAIQSVAKIRQAALEGITNPAVLRLAEPLLNARAQAAIEAINKHSGQQSRLYQVQTADSRAQINLQDASLNYANEKQFRQALDVSRLEAESLGKLQGWDEDTIRLQAAKFQDLGYKLRYDAWRLKDPAGAFANFQQNAEQISPVVRDQIGRQLFQAAAPVMAAELNRVGGYGVADPAPAPGTTAGAATGPLPRGIRNNNPGNIIKSTAPWQGEVGGDDPKYASFATPEAGIRAMGKTLLTYQDKHGLNTVEGIVSRWAPATENDTAAYATTVAKALGVKVGTPIDLHDSAVLGKLTRAMIQVENGSGGNRITDEQIALGLASAGTGSALPTTTRAAPAAARRDPAAPSGVPMVDALPDDWKLHVMQLARAQGHQDMAEAREMLRGKVQDSTAEFMATGFAQRPPNEAEFVRAYGQSEGVSRYRDFQGVAVLGQTLQQVHQLPTAALSDLLKSSKPTPGDGFASRQHNFEILTRAIDQVRQAREKDPVGYALSNLAYSIKPLQSMEPKALAQELPRRAAAARQMAAEYGTTPQLFSKDEAKVFGATIKAAPVEAQKAQLALIYQGIGDMDLFKQTMQTLAPDSPTVAVAGVYQARGLRTTGDRDVADLILRGQAILSPNTKEDGKGHMGGAALLKMPEEKLMLSEWNSETGDAFKGKEHAADLFMQTAKAVYAARSAEEGDYTGAIDAKRWRAAIGMATGGIIRHNGAKIVAPYGMEYDKFQDALKTEVGKVAAVGATPGEMMRLPLENVGDGRYLFRRGAGYLVDTNGRPVVVNLSGGR